MSFDKRNLTTKCTKITKDSQRLMQFLITRETFCPGFVPFVSFVVYTRRRSRFDWASITEFNHKDHEAHKGLAKVSVLYVSHLCGKLVKILRYAAASSVNLLAAMIVKPVSLPSLS